MGNPDTTQHVYLNDPTARNWKELATTRVTPPREYWNYIAGSALSSAVAVLLRFDENRAREIAAPALPPPREPTLKLLERAAADGWFERQERRRCGNCREELSPEDYAQTECPRCHVPYTDKAVESEIVFVRDLADSRSVEWLVAIHGMNTSGAWQEAFTWRFSTTWGQSVPVAVYKYGIIRVGVLLPFRRRQLQKQLRSKLDKLRHEARIQGFTGKPDVIAHSFGTWLFGHVLRDELKRKPEERLRFGRVILTGCILRPDFPWEALKHAGLVEDVMNHYGTSDPVVPLAHVVIWDSGPSGRRGFDGNTVVNVRAAQFRHSDLFTETNLPESYSRVWRPFLTLPNSEFASIPNRQTPTRRWRALPWPLRGVVFPFLAIPLLISAIALLIIVAGRFLSLFGEPVLWIAGCTVGGVLVLIPVLAFFAMLGGREKI